MRKFKRIAAYFVAALFLAIIGSALLSLSARSAELENEVSIRHALPGGRHYKALVYKTLNDLQYWLRRYPVRGEWIVILIPDEDDRRITIVDVRMLSETGDQIVFHECDIKDAHNVYAVIEQVKPDKIFHLAGQSFVPASWESPA